MLIDSAPAPSLSAPPPVISRLWARRDGALRLATTVADQIVVSGSNVFIAILLARWLPKSEFGAYSVLFSCFSLILGFHNAFLIEPLSVFAGGLFRGCLAAYARQGLKLHAAIVVAVVPVAGVLAVVFAPAANGTVAFVAALVVAVAFSLFYVLVRRLAYAAGLHVQALAAGILNLAVTLSCMQAARVAGRLSWSAGLASQAAGGLCAAALLWVLLSRSRFRSPSGVLSFSSVISEHWGYGRWALLTAAVFWLSSEAYCALVGRVLGASPAAGFRAVLNLTMLAPNFLAAVAVLSLPYAAGLAHGGRGAELLRFTRVFCGACWIVSLAVAGVIWAGGSRLLQMLYGAQYGVFSSILPWLLANMVVLSASQSLQMRVRAVRRPRVVFEGFVAAGACTCTLGLLLTSTLALTGAAIAICCSALSFAFVLVVRSRQCAAVA